MNDHIYVDHNWCPDCGLPRGVCTCSVHPDCHNWELIWDDGVGQQLRVCLICMEERIFHYDPYADDEDDYIEDDIGQGGGI